MSGSHPEGAIYFSPFTAPSSGTFLGVEASIGPITGDTGVFEAAIYTAPAGVPEELVGLSEPKTFTVPTFQWVHFPLVTAAPVTAGEPYAVCLRCIDVTTGFALAVRVSDTGSRGSYSSGTFTQTFPATPGPSLTSGNFNFIANYCP